MADAPSRPPSISMQRLQRADKWLGWLVCLCLQPLRWLRGSPSPSGPRDADLERVLMIKFWGIGSLVLLTPAVRALRKRHPRARLTLLTLRENEALARGLEVFDEVLVLDVRARPGPVGWTRVLARIVQLLFVLRRARFQAVYDFEFFTRFSAFVSFATGAKTSTGFDEPSVWRGQLHPVRVPFNRYWHVSRNFRALAGGENGEDIRPADIGAFRVADRDLASLRAKLLARGVRIDRPYVVLNPNAGQLSLERRWPRESFAALARALVEQDETLVFLIGSPAEREYVAPIAAWTADLGSLCVDLSGELSLGELAALLERAGTVVSNDSGPMHIAASLRAPVVGLFGPETPVLYAPIGVRARHLWRPPVCSPCINVHENKVANCVRGRPECLTNLSVDDVLEEARLALWDGVLRPAPRAIPLHPAAAAENLPARAGEVRT
ncbi:MAG: glycosyltransferase family 9 protein [Planctomycetia bacterium]